MNAVSPPNSLAIEAGLAYLPIFLDARNRTVLLIGGGEGMPAKHDLLQRAGARIRLVDPATEPLHARHFAHAVVAIDASDDPEINQLARQLARAAGIPLNVVDRPALCDFVVPAILDRAPVIIAVSTGGLAPAIARLIRQRLETAIPAGIGRLAVLAARFRTAVAQRLPSYRQSTLLWERLFDSKAAQLALAGRSADAVLLAEVLIAELEVEQDAPIFSIVPVSSDDPELLTLRAARLLKTADLIVHDPAIATPILDLSRRDARRIALARSGDLDSILTRHARPDGLAVYLRAAEY